VCVWIEKLLVGTFSKLRPLERPSHGQVTPQIETPGQTRRRFCSLLAPVGTNFSGFRIKEKTVSLSKRKGRVLCPSHGKGTEQRQLIPKGGTGCSAVRWGSRKSSTMDKAREGPAAIQGLEGPRRLGPEVTSTKPGIMLGGSENDSLGRKNPVGVSASDQRTSRNQRSGTTKEFQNRGGKPRPRRSAIPPYLGISPKKEDTS